MKGWGEMVRSKTECFNFAAHVARGKWTSVFAAFLIMSTSGTKYLFSMYSTDIKTNFGYSQSMSSTLNKCNDIGTTMGILSGLIVEVIPTRFVLLMGSITNFLGYFMIWLAFTERIHKPEFWLMCVYIFIGAHAQNFAVTASVVTSLKNFPERRSMLLGLFKGYQGLSGSILSIICSAIYGDDSASLILLSAWLPALVSLSAMYIIGEKKVNIRQQKEVNVFYHFLYLSAALAAYLMTMTLVQSHIAFRAAYVGFAIVLCILLFLPGVVALRQEVVLWKEMQTPPTTIIVEIPRAVEQDQNFSANQEEAEEDTIVVEEEQNSSEVTQTSCFAAISNKPKRGEDFGILQALVSTDMLIIFLATFVGLGSCLTALENMQQIGEALQYEPKTVITLISLINIWNFFGRVLCGFISEKLVRKYQVPRPLMLSAVLFMSCIGLLFIAFPFKNSIYLASVIISFTLGAQLPLALSVIFDLFGLKHYATLFNCGQVASPLGQYLLNNQFTRRLYDIEAMQLHGSEGLGMPLVCKGKQCFCLSFTFMAIATFFGGLLSLILAARTQEFYQSDIYRRYRGEELETVVASTLSADR
ncbi:uncharacterized protein LOC132171308 [Corylus avellana]|uniref:uncharacterized protein LOC132171308 n=1 Tax=Corylus avellana TaxID=13451 RepID=UPI001E21C0B1|nr:uncharacterized protein LOC132171308 [Corylus avellana]